MHCLFILFQVHYLTLLHYICIQPVYTQFNNPEQALLHSQSQAALNNKYKERSASDPATKSAHLHDKAARNALQSLENRFHKSAQPITAAPGVDTSQWPLRNYALITLDATSALKSRTGRTKALRNNTQKPAVDMTIHSAHSKRGLRTRCGFYYLVASLMTFSMKSILQENNNLMGGSTITILSLLVA